MKNVWGFYQDDDNIKIKNSSKIGNKCENMWSTGYISAIWDE